MPVGSRRSELDIVQEILKSESGTTSELRNNANLSHAQLVKYLGFLERSSLIDVERNGSRALSFQVTAKGRTVLEHLERLYQLFYPDNPDHKPPLS